MLGKMIDQLSQDLKMEDLITTDEFKGYRLPFDNDIEIEARESANGYLLKGLIGESPKQLVEGFFLKAMESNLFGIGTRGSVIGLKEDGKLLTLSLELDYNSSYKEFKEKLEDFISVIDFWRKEILNHQKKAT